MQFPINYFRLHNVYIDKKFKQFFLEVSNKSSRFDAIHVKRVEPRQFKNVRFKNRVAISDWASDVNSCQK